MNKIILDFGGKPREFHFGLGFIGKMLEETNTNMIDFDKVRLENPFKWIPLMMFYSLSYSVNRKGEIADFDLFDVTDWIDELPADSKVLFDFNNAFTQSLVKNVPSLPENNNQPKKKLTGKKM